MKNMRQRPRVEINHTVTYTCHDGNDDYGTTDSGMLMNISTNGILIESGSPFTGRFLVIANNSSTNPRLINGEIVYSETVAEPDGKKSGIYRAGVKFTDLHENSKEFVVSIVQPEAVNGQSEVETEASEDELSFDFISINEILNDDTPTEDLILIEDLLENGDSYSDDVLEDLSVVLQEKEKKESEEEKIEEKAIPVSTESRSEVITAPCETSKFLHYFNITGFSIVCIGILFILVFNFNGQSLDQFTEAEILFNKLIAETKVPETSELKTVSIVNKSVNSRFVKKEKAGYQFIIDGTLSNVSEMNPDEISVTAKIFNKENSLLGKVSITPREKKMDEPQLLHFLATFSNPPEGISRFTVNIEI